MRKQHSKRVNRKKNGSRGLAMIPHPPPILNIALQKNGIMRFNCNSAVNQGITFQNILDTINVAATATTAFDLFNAVKVNYVEVWQSAVSSTSTNSVSVAFAQDGTGGDERLHTDTAMGIEPAHVRAKPSKNATASFWNQSGNVQCFFLTCGAGAVVDVHATFRNSMTGGVVATQNAPVGATAGVLYYRGLDGLAFAATKLTPVSVQLVN